MDEPEVGCKAPEWFKLYLVIVGYTLDWVLFLLKNGGFELIDNLSLFNNKRFWKQKAFDYVSFYNKRSWVSCYRAMEGFLSRAN